jgi:hypothetical protein
MRALMGALTGALLLIFTISTAEAQSAEIGQAYIEQLNVIADALDTIDDEASAREAAVEIGAANMELEEIADSMQGLSDNEMLAMVQSIAPQLTEIQGRIATTMQRLSANPEYFSIIGDELSNMPNMQ